MVVSELGCEKPSVGVGWANSSVSSKMDQETYRRASNSSVQDLHICFSYSYVGVVRGTYSVCTWDG